MRISVLIPAFNEEGNIQKTIDLYAQVLQAITSAFEVIVVNDGSTDATRTILEDLAKARPYLKAYHHPFNKGMGAAIKTGVVHAQYELIFTTCADLQFDPQEIKKFLPLAERADVIAGYRTNLDYAARRRFVTFINLALLRVFFGLRLRNPNWVKLFRRKVFDTIPIETNGFFWDSELLIKAQDKGYTFAEVPTTFHPRTVGVAMGSNPVRVFRTFLTFLRFWLHYKLGI